MVLHALPPQVILLLQTNVTARVELENRLADLTDAQLGMLEQLFPRHVIEYMLSHKHGYNSRNLTHLANHHDDVIVLFTDVVGFTSMSKEVEPSEVGGAGLGGGCRVRVERALTGPSTCQHDCIGSCLDCAYESDPVSSACQHACIGSCFECAYKSDSVCMRCASCRTNQRPRA